MKPGDVAARGQLLVLRYHPVQDASLPFKPAGKGTRANLVPRLCHQTLVESQIVVGQQDRA